MKNFRLSFILIIFFSQAIGMQKKTWDTRINDFDKRLEKLLEDVTKLFDDEWKRHIASKLQSLTLERGALEKDAEKNLEPLEKKLCFYEETWKVLMEADEKIKFSEQKARLNHHQLFYQLSGSKKSCRMIVQQDGMLQQQKRLQIGRIIAKNYMDNATDKKKKEYLRSLFD